MLGLILGIILLVAGIIVGCYLAKNKEYSKLSPVGFVGGIVLAVVVILLSMFTTIETGHTGVITVFGRVEDSTFDSGFHIKAPWQTVVQMDNRVQKDTLTLSCFSSDIQEVKCIYTLNYQIDKTNAQTIYKTVGKDYYTVVVTPSISESVKTVFAKYTAEELIGNRNVIAETIEELLGGSLKGYNINVVSTAIEDIDFTDTFTNAVEAKQVAAQNKLKAEIEQAQAIKQAEADANVAKTKAQADAEVAKINAEADLEVQKINADAAEYAGQKESAVIKAISSSLDEEVLKYYLIQKWNGEYPETYLGSDSVSTILDIGK